jgi:hypothetical protein
MQRTSGDLVGQILAALGARRLFGEPLERLDLDFIDAPPDLAVALADCAGRISGYGVASLGDQFLHISSRPGGTANPMRCESLAEFAAAMEPLRVATALETVAVQLDFDLAAPAEESSIAAFGASRAVVVTLDPALADLNIVAVVGPGATRVIGENVVAALARNGSIPVLNSFGAKGVVRWDSPFHMGTAGLQAGDAVLAGLGEADIVITCGLDVDEFGPADLGNDMVVDVAPAQLTALLANWPRRSVDDDAPSGLFGAISGVVRPLYESTDDTLSAARAALHLSGAAPEDGVVVADAGVAGFWIGRTFPTGVMGSVLLPSRSMPGFAVGTAMLAGLDGRAAIAVVDEIDEDSAALLDLAGSIGAPVAVQRWVEGTSSADAHVAATLDDFAGASGVRDVAVDTSALHSLIDVAGPVTAWI